MWLKKAYENGNMTKEQYLKMRLAMFRQMRSEQFKAFDVWEKAVLRGREPDNPEVMQWYAVMKAFPEAITENTTCEDYPKTPEVIKKYLMR